ncbi:hypothetical protein HB952_14040 [Listeria welshimeri]|uniref:hypothetical protein n=2 Tax=Listeria TaxID=1637 RepID=UPI0004F790E1|nr:hypothetical protein [Listeria welshimeri]AIL68952.1 hypothetical protein IJ09_14550 [Listeria monocytogenes]EAD1841999.1 hypothetical protein [Listeria monocytogenes]EAD7934022.1 hypothetical protein [Listeria monocytogenes]EAE1772518.1 hypothetical protein [Listeria monocytogenes]EAG9437512.1 hypothetical protein [Listeria monocytogenes]
MSTLMKIKEQLTLLELRNSKYVEKKRYELSAIKPNDEEALSWMLGEILSYRVQTEKYRKGRRG